MRLHALECRMSNLLYLGPPLPRSPTELCEWTESESPPILDPWQPPAWITHIDRGCFMLNDQTACFQRGYCPKSVYEPILSVFAQGFGHSIETITQVLKNDSFDYIIAIRDYSTQEIAAACLVEIRCTAANKSNTPYLYIYELTTNTKFGRHGMAQQLVHAVDALAFLMKSDEGDGNIWRNTLKGRRLCTGLTVQCTQERSIVDNLVRLYSKSGLRTRDSAIPQIDYMPFTSFSERDWCIDRDTANYIAMWKEVTPPVVYSDGVVNIMKEANATTYPYYCHIFPASMHEHVKNHGIVHPAHKCLHDGCTKNVYIASGESLTFLRHNKSTMQGCHVFAIQAECSSPSFKTHSSIPSWYAAFIGPFENMPAA